MIESQLKDALGELAVLDLRLRGVSGPPVATADVQRAQTRRVELGELVRRLVPPVCPPGCVGDHSAEVLDAGACWYFHVAHFGEEREVQVAVCQNFDPADDPADPATVTFVGRVEDDDPDYAKQIGSALLEAASLARRWRAR